jgi:N6-adenosine-specific RNA methylase IME4
MNKKYQIIYADPPWKYGFWYQSEDVKRNAADHYAVMDTGNICSLPISDITDDNCALFLWATMPCLPDSLEVIKGWGFRYVTCAFVWTKMNGTGFGLFTGLGNYTRANAELCLLGMRGSLPRQSHDVHQIVMTPITEHSRKPSIVRERIVELFGDLPRIELFARRKVDGWDCWGNEVESDIEL